MVINYNNLIAQTRELSEELNAHLSTVDWRKTLEKHKSIIEERIAQGIVPERFQAPLGVQFEVTHACNLHCIHCYNYSGRAQLTSFGDDITDAQWLDVAQQVADLEVFESIISGGEPLLRKNLVFRMMDILAQSKMWFIFITNGWLCDESVVRQLLKYNYHYVQVSIDGASPATHDLIRQREGSWEHATRAASLIKAAGLPLCVASTIMKQNAHEVEEIIEMAIALGANQLIIDRYMSTGAAAQNGDEIALDENWRRKFSETIFRKRLEHDGKINIMTSIEVPIQLRQSVIDINKVVLIRPNGDVKLDCIAPFTFGNVTRSSLAEIWVKSAAAGWKKPEVVDFVSKIVTDASLRSTDEMPIPHLDQNINLDHYLKGGADAV